MKRGTWTVLMAAALLASGCTRIVGGIYHLSPPTNRVTVERNVMAPMPDGVRLAADVYHPRGIAQSPVILIRTPYGKGSGGDPTSILNTEVAKLFASRGYTVVVQDTRGRYASEGDFYAMINEIDDGHATLAWVQAQPWSTGKVAGWGASYFGFTQWTMADGTNLAAFVPMITTAEIINIEYEGGAMNFANMYGWNLGNRGRTGETIKPKDLARGLNHLPLIDADDVVVHQTVPAYDDVAAYRAPALYANRIEYNDRYREVSAPALSIGGWYDLFQKYQIEDFIRLRQEAKGPARSQSRLIIGPWGHGMYQKPPIKFKNGGIVKLGQLDRVLAFYDQWLKGKPQGQDWPPFYVYVMGAAEWRGFNEWPPAGVKPTAYYLHGSGQANTKKGDGGLSLSAPTAETADRFTYDPAHPVPTVGGPLLGADLGPKKQDAVEARGDVLVYTTDALGAPLTLIGPIKLSLFAASDARDTDFTAKLCDVYPNGMSVNINDGIIRARFRNRDLTKPELIEPGKAYEYTIDLWHTAIVVPPGHRLRLQISSSNFPRFDRNLNTGEDIATGTRIAQAQQTIYHDAAHPSHLILPVMP
jgi:uncharacterized protein